MSDLLDLINYKLYLNQGKKDYQIILYFKNN